MRRCYEMVGAQRYRACIRAAARKVGGHFYCGYHANKIERDLAVRLAADAVVKAADAWERAREDRGWHPTEYNFACGELEDAIRAHRKALAEQAKEASRG